MSAAWTHEQLNDYLDDRLSSNARARLESLLQQDHQAHDALRELQQQRARFRAVPRYQLGPDFAANVIARLPAGSMAGVADHGPTADGPGTPDSVAESSIEIAGSRRFTGSTAWGSVGTWRMIAASMATLAATLLLVFVFGGRWPLSPDSVSQRSDGSIPQPTSQPTSESTPGQLVTTESNADSDELQRPDKSGVANPQPPDAAASGVFAGEPSGVDAKKQDMLGIESKAGVKDALEIRPDRIGQLAQANKGFAAPAGGSGRADLPDSPAETGNAAAEVAEIADAEARTASSKPADFEALSDGRLPGDFVRSAASEGAAETGSESASPSRLVKREAATVYYYDKVLQIQTGPADVQVVQRFLQESSGDGQVLDDAGRLAYRQVELNTNAGRRGVNTRDDPAADPQPVADIGDQFKTDAATLNLQPGRPNLVVVEATPDQMTEILRRLGGQQTVLVDQTMKNPPPGDSADELRDNTEGDKGGGLGGGAGLGGDADRLRGSAMSRNQTGLPDDTGSAGGRGLAENMPQPAASAAAGMSDGPPVAPGGFQPAPAENRPSDEISWRPLQPLPFRTAGGQDQPMPEAAGDSGADVLLFQGAVLDRVEKEKSLAGSALRLRYLLVLQIDESQATPPAAVDDR